MFKNVCGKLYKSISTRLLVEVFCLYIIHFRFAHSQGEILATSVRSLGRKVQPHYYTRNRVGEFFEQNAIALLGAIPNTEGGLEHGDISISKLALGIEVKSGNSDQAMKIPIEQKRRYEKIPFPYGNFAYLLCCYKNRIVVSPEKGLKRLRGLKGRAVSHLQRETERGAQHLILSRKIFNHYLLDIEIMNALENVVGVTRGSQPPREKEYQIELKRREHIYRFHPKDFVETMKWLKLNPKLWVLRQYDVAYSFPITEPDFLGLGGLRETEYYSVKYRFFTVLQKNFDMRFFKYFSGLQKNRLLYADPAPSP